MKKFTKIFGIAAIIAVILFAMAACDNSTTSTGKNVPAYNDYYGLWEDSKGETYEISSGFATIKYLTSWDYDVTIISVETVENLSSLNKDDFPQGLKFNVNVTRSINDNRHVGDKFSFNLFMNNDKQSFCWGGAGNYPNLVFFKQP